MIQNRKSFPIIIIQSKLSYADLMFAKPIWVGNLYILNDINSYFFAVCNNKAAKNEYKPDN